jgi:hypothetical protein
MQDDPLVSYSPAVLIVGKHDPRQRGLDRAMDLLPALSTIFGPQNPPVVTHRNEHPFLDSLDVKEPVRRGDHGALLFSYRLGSSGLTTPGEC